MFWRSENEVVIEFVNLFRRVLKYQTTWNNIDLQIVDFGDNTPKVYEKFFEDNEKYPIITVAGGGYVRSAQAFNTFLDTFQSRIVDMGTRGLGIALVDSDHSVSFALPAGIDTDEILHSIDFHALSTETENNLGNLNIDLHQDSFTGSVVASASIPFIVTPVYKKYFSEFSPHVTLTADTYWLVFNTSVNNSFLVGIDTTASNVFNHVLSGSVIEESGSMHGRLYTPPLMRLGGAIEGTIVIKCSDKNTTRRPREILSIIANYISLLTQAELTRSSGVDNTTLAMGSGSIVDEWLKKEIRIKAIRQGSSQERRRGENDIIHSYDLMVDYYTEWHQDYQKDLLSGFTIDINDAAINLFSDIDIDLDF